MVYTLPITNPNPKDGDIRVNIYGYIPSLSLAAATLAIFAVYAILHAFYFIYFNRKKSSLKFKVGTRTFEGLISLGCILEIVGYSFRIASHHDPYTLRSFILNYFMIVVAPVLFSAAFYLSFTTFVQQSEEAVKMLPMSCKAIVTGENKRRLETHLIYPEVPLNANYGMHARQPVFVISDVITIIIQIAGAALIGVSESSLASGDVPPLTPDQANDILTAGLAVQVASFTIFLLIIGLFLRRLRSNRKQLKGDNVESGVRDLVMPRHTGTFFTVLLSSSLFILLRTVFRLAEAAPGQGSASSRNEDLFAALETAPVLAGIAIWTAFPLGKLVNSS